VCEEWALILFEVPEYDRQRGLHLEWDEGFEIGLEVQGPDVRLTGNREGLRSLARHLLTLAQAGVPSGAHVHLTADQEVEGSMDLILERRDDWSEGR
jgi:hypothetical protein